MRKLNNICSYENKEKYISKQKIDLRTMGNTIVSGFKKINFKSLPVILVIIAICIGIAGGTIAYIIANTLDVQNTFTPGYVTSEVKEQFIGTKKIEAKIKNTGNVDAYIRVAVIANTITKDDTGNIYVTGLEDVSAKLGGENWKLGNDGYYYFKQKVEPQGLTDDIVLTDIDLSDIQVSIAGEAIQALGKNADGKFAVEDAWSNKTTNTKVSVNADGTLSVGVFPIE